MPSKWATEHLSCEEVAYWTAWCQKSFVTRKPLRYLGRMFSRHPIRRGLHRWFFATINRVLLRDAWDAMRGEHHFRGFSGVNSLWKPRWYDS